MVLGVRGKFRLLFLDILDISSEHLKIYWKRYKRLFIKKANIRI